MALAPGLARKVKKVLETRVDDPEIVPCLKTLSDFYPENTRGETRCARDLTIFKASPSPLPVRPLEPDTDRSRASLPLPLPLPLSAQACARSSSRMA